MGWGKIRDIAVASTQLVRMLVVVLPLSQVLVAQVRLSRIPLEVLILSSTQYDLECHKSELRLFCTWYTYMIENE